MDMAVHIIGPLSDAEKACVSVFGEDANAGPVRPAPKPLLELLKDWPGLTTQVHTLILELPSNFDILAEMGKNQVKGVHLNVCRVTVLHQGHKIGYAIRTNELGMNAIDIWERAWRAYGYRLAQAH